MNRAIGIGVILLVGIGLAWFVVQKNADSVGTPQESPTNTTLSMYASASLGIAFAYPAEYVINEQTLPGSAERFHHVITLMRASDLPLPEGGEGPPAMTIEMFQNNLDAYTTESWIRNSNASNFKLSIDGRLASTSIGGEPALFYSWDGLYRGETIAIARPAYVYVFSVTYADAADSIRSDFKTLTQSVVFQ